MDHNEAREKKFRTLTEQPVEKLIVRMAIPTIVTMLISSLYNMTDTIFVGRVSTEATAAVGIVFSFMALTQAVGFFFGHGSGNYISRALGQRDIQNASVMAATGFFSAIAIGILIAIVGQIFAHPIVRILGATETLVSETLRYFRLILIGSPFLTASLVMNNQLRLQGNAFFAMIGIATGAVCNIILDPIFIFGLHMGVAGAAAATAISQLISFVLLWIGSKKSGNILIELNNFSFSFRRYLEIAKGGLPSLCRQGLASIAVILLNQAAGLHGDSAIAAFSVVSKTMMFSGSAIIGFGQGFQPVCGFNYSAGLHDRVKRAFWFSVKVTTTILVVLSIVGFIFAPNIISLFRAEDRVLIEIASAALRYQLLAFPLWGWTVITNMMLQNIGQAFKATLLAMGRQGLFFIPTILIFPSLFGLPGLQISQPISDLFTFLLSIPLAFSVLNQLKPPKE